MIAEIIASLSLLLWAFCFVVCVRVYRSVKQGGVREIEELKKRDFGLRALLTGEMKDFSDDPMTNQGFDIVVDNGKIVKNKVVRTIKRDY